jgi:hypothetical protein
MTTQQPSRDEFISYWKDVDAPFRLRDLASEGIYIGGLAIIAVVARLSVPSDSSLLLWMIAAGAYLTLVPSIFLPYFFKRRARFVHCPHCDAYFRKERHWEAVIGTGRCAICRKQVLRDFCM